MNFSWPWTSTIPTLFLLGKSKYVNPKFIEIPLCFSSLRLSVSLPVRGLDELVQKIDEISEDIEEKKTDAPSRMSIDRVFSLKGFGTIVTGTLIEGKISVDDEMTIYPSEKKVKVRNLQVHGCDVKTAYAGQRTAINLSNIKVSLILNILLIYL